MGKECLKNWWEKSAAYAAPITVPETSAIAGGQICVWGDRMQPSSAYAPRHDMLCDEFSNLRARIPAFAQKVWSSYNSPEKEAFKADVSVYDRLLTKLLAK